MGKLTAKEFLRFSEEYRRVAPIVAEVTEIMEKRSRELLKQGGCDVDDFDFFEELYLKGYKLIKIKQ